MSVSYVRNNCDLDAYAGSPGFLGYSESIASNIDDVRSVIQCFFNFWSLDYIQQANLVISLTRNSLIEDISAFLEEVLDSLRNKNWIQDYIDDCDINSSLKSFSLTDIVDREIEDLFSVVMLGLTYGHVFVTWNQDGIILYPHDDSGFGVIASSDRVVCQKGQEFLDYVNQYSNSVVSLRKQM